MYKKYVADLVLKKSWHLLKKYGRIIHELKVKFWKNKKMAKCNTFVTI